MNLTQMPLYRFFVQVSITFMILIFCGIGLTSNTRQQTLYSNLVFLIIGYWLPSPGSGSKKEGDSVAIDSAETNVYQNPKL